MTTSIFSVAPSNTTAATFRAWGGGLSAALAAVGLVKTTDTGQIDWSTVAAPGGAVTYMGYEIWRFNDALQSTYPLFLKIEYGSGTSTGTNPGVRFTIGKGSDGAGAITGVLMAAAAVSAASSISTPSNWYVSSGDGPMLGVLPAPTFFDAVGAGGSWYFAMERSRNAAGAATGTGLMFIASTALPRVRVISYASGNTVSPDYFPAAIPSTASGTGVGGGGNTPLFTGIVTDGMGNFWQPRSFLAGHKADIGQLTQMSVPGYGTYLFHSGVASFSSLASLQHCGAMAWF